MDEQVDNVNRLKLAVKASISKYKIENRNVVKLVNSSADSINCYCRDFKLNQIENINYNTIYGLILELKAYFESVVKYMYIYILDKLINKIVDAVDCIYYCLDKRSRFTCEEANELRAHMNELENYITNSHGLIMPEHVFVNHYKLTLPTNKEADDDRLNKYIISHKQLCIYSSLYKKFAGCWSHLFNDDEMQYIELTLADYKSRTEQFCKTMDILNVVYFTENRPDDYEAIIDGLDLTPWKSG